MPSLFSARSGIRRTPSLGTMRRAGSPIALGLLTGTAVLLALPAPAYRAIAVVAPEGGGARSASDMRQLADFALSRPVLRAAAADLLARREAQPLPGPLERLSLIRLEGEADRVARLADQLAAAGHAAPSGDALMIGAEAGEAQRAAVVAQALAGAFLAKRAEATATAQRTREAELATRIASVEAAASAARKRFLAAGGADAGIEKARAAATAEVREAEVRVSRLRGILASGSPPVADDAAATQAIGDIQGNYLDLQGKLAQALQTLGERHTTVITLRDSIRRAGSELSAAWTRQLHAAEADRDAAKQREAALFRNDPGKDAGRQAALEEARRAKDAADTALLRAEAELDFLPDQPAFVLRAAAAVPAGAVGGWFPLGRAFAAVGAGLLSLLALLAARRGLGRLRGRLTPSRRPATREQRREPSADMPAPVPANDSVPEAAPMATQPVAAISTIIAAPVQSVWDAPLRTAQSAAAQPPAAASVAAPIDEPGAASSRDEHPVVATELPPRFFRAAAAAVIPTVEPLQPVASVDARATDDRLRRSAVVEELAAMLEARQPSVSSEALALRALREGFGRLVGELRALTPANGPIPTLMVAAGRSDAGKLDDGKPDANGATTDVALAIGEVAAGLGLRVLLVEATRACGSLAEHVERERRPSLVGMRDGLRLVFAADTVAGLFLAPLFARRGALVAALSRHRGAPLVEEVAAHYDLLLVDGGDAAAAAHAGWSADRYLAVGAEATLAAHARFLAALGHPAGGFAGTVIDATFVPPPAEGRQGTRPEVSLAAA